MKILSIDTASDICGVSILENENLICNLDSNTGRTHSENLMPMVEDAFSKSNLSLKDIDLLVCDKGPGSFTGIRIGVGTVLAFRDCLNIPCIGISSLEALAYNVNSEGLICSLIDAKNDNVYYGLFKLQNSNYSRVEDFEFKNIHEVINYLKNYSTPITFVGDGSVAHKDVISENLIDSNFCEKNNLSSFALGIAGLNAYSNNVETSIMPLYLRKSQAERALEGKKLM